MWDFIQKNGGIFSKKLKNFKTRAASEFDFFRYCMCNFCGGEDSNVQLLYTQYIIFSKNYAAQHKACSMGLDYQVKVFKKPLVVILK